MSNTRKAGPKTTKVKSYKFSNFRAEAAKAPKQESPVIPPFVMDDIEPPIVITAPDTVERQLIMAEMMNRFDVGSMRMLLQALCGDQFNRVWYLIKDDKDPNTLMALVKAMTEHFNTVVEELQEAGELPGGSEDSSV